MHLSIGTPNRATPIIVGMATMIGDRLREAREELQRREGVRPNKAAFAREIGIEPASLSELESGDSKSPKSETLLRIRDRGINPDYIMYGKGPKFLVESIERRLERETLMSMIEELDDDERNAVTEIARALIRKKAKGSPNDPFKKNES